MVPLLIAHTTVTRTRPSVRRDLVPVYPVHATTLAICIAVAHALGLDVASTGFGLIALGAVVPMAAVLLQAWDEPVRSALQRTRRAVDPVVR